MPVVRGRRRARLGPRRLGSPAMAPCLLPRGTFAESPSLPQADERVGLAHVQFIENQVSTGHPRSRHLRRNPPSQEWAPPDAVFPPVCNADIIVSGAPEEAHRRSAMLPLFDFAGELETEPFVFEEELKSNESLSLEALRTISRYPRPRPVVPDASAISEVPNRR